MNIEILISHNFFVFDGRISYMRSASALLDVLTNLEQSGIFRTDANEISLYRRDIVKAFDEGHRSVADRTIKLWLNILARNGAIKYKGERYNEPKKPMVIMINPLFNFCGSNADFEKVKAKWRRFRSDVEVVKEEFDVV